MFDFLKRRPMLLCAVASSAVSVVGIYAEGVLFCLCPLILLLIFVMLYKSARREIVLSAILVLLVAISTLAATKNLDKALLLDGSSCTGEFIVVEEPINHGDYYSVTLEVVESNILNKGDKISASYGRGDFHISDRITATLDLRSMDDYKGKYSFYSNGIFHKAYIEDFKLVGNGDAVLSAVGKIRNYIKDEIFKYYGKGEAATMLALTTGDKSYFTNRFYGNVKASGVAHVMVVSGMHLSIIVSFALWFTNKLFYNRYFKAVVVLFVTLVVMAICGFTMSVMRAGITYIIMALALISKRESTPENTLGAAVSIILLFNPLAIMNVAFQLSVLSTFAILCVALPVYDYIQKQKIIKSKAIKSVLLSVLISLFALVFTAPVTIYIFGYISNVSPITNLLIGTPASFAMSFCILGFLVPPLKPILFFISDVIVIYMNGVINFFGSLPFATTNTPVWLSFVAVIFIVAILWILIACKNRINMIKLREVRLKKRNERGKLKWQS